MILQNKEYDLVAAGHICLDIIPQFPDTGARSPAEIFRPGKLVNIGPCALSTGGPVSNTGLGAARLGCRVAFMARVGDDMFGQSIRQMLEKSGSSAGVKVASGVSSSYTVALAPPRIDRMFLHCPGANDSFTSADVSWEIVAQAGLFHLGYPPLMRGLYADDGRELAEVFRRARQAGATTSLDMALPDPQSVAGRAPWARIIERVLPHVDIFLPSMEEAFFMLYPAEFLERKQAREGGELLEDITEAECSQMAATFLEMGAAMTALKSGHRGYYFRTGGRAALERLGAVRPANPAAWCDREIWCPAYRVDPIASATGSGDSSIAGFLTAFLRGLSLEECLQTANCTGYQNLHALDAVSGIRTWEETWSLLTAGRLPVIDPLITDSRWRRASSRQLWFGPHDRP